MRKIAMLSLALIISVLTGCGGGGSGGGNGATSASSGGGAGGTPPAATAPTIEVFPASFTLPPGGSQQFTATLVSPDGSKQDVTNSVTWTITTLSGQGVVEFDPNIKGMVKAVNQGSVQVTANTSGVSGSGTLKVLPLSSISISGDATLPAGINAQLTAVGTFSDNSTEEITPLASWASANASIVTVNSKGVITTVSPGAAPVTATLAGVTGTIGITVTSALLNSLALDPGDTTMAIGTVKKFIVTGSYSDNSTHNLTASASWSSSNPAAATIGATPDSSGRMVVSALAQGSSTIKAVFGGKTASSVVQVTGASLVTLMVAPETPTVGLGIETVQLTAIGTFSDGTAQDVTDAVTWTSDAPSIAVVSNSAVNSGEVTTVSVGQKPATVTATMPTAGAVSAKSVITVTPPEPTVVTVFPTVGPIGQQVHVRGTNFVAGTTVTIGGITGVETQVASSSFLSFYVPTGFTSSSVTVVTPKGSAASTEVFTVADPTDAPTVTGVSPTLGPAGQTVTVQGANFRAGDTTVNIAGAAVPATVLDVNTLIFTVPPLPDTTASTITVATSRGTSAPSAATFTVGTPSGAPTITKIDYAYGPVGAYRIIEGTNFVFGGTTINMGGLTKIDHVTVYSPTLLSFIVSAGMVGNTKVTVVTSKGSADTAEVFILTKR